MTDTAGKLESNMKIMLLAAAALSIGIGSAYAGEGEGGIATSEQWFTTQTQPSVRSGHAVVTTGTAVAIKSSSVVQRQWPTQLFQPSDKGGM